MKGLLAAVLLTLAATHVHGQAHTDFSGIPSVKISEGGLERSPETVDRAKAANLACVISEIGGKYYWASRENKLMVRHEGGAFVTYVAVDGAGYVRTILPSLKAAASLMSPTEERFDYVEHVVLGLRSVTYYGSRK
jgi:hypothetical protein